MHLAKTAWMKPACSVNTNKRKGLADMGLTLQRVPLKQQKEPVHSAKAEAATSVPTMLSGDMHTTELKRCQATSHPIHIHIPSSIFSPAVDIIAASPMAQEEINHSIFNSIVAAAESGVLS